jgi:hypothetical protein
MTMSNKPAVPQALLRLLLPGDRREKVSGDLLEEYREARMPALGQLRANLWYWRQVGGIWLRAYWWCVVPVTLLLVVHDIFNTFRAPSGASYLDGMPAFALAPISPLVGVGFFGLAGAYGSWHTQRWAGGFVAALGTFFVVWLVHGGLVERHVVPVRPGAAVQSLLDSGVAMEHASRAPAIVLRVQSGYAR